jgi:hypothetical protein
VDHGLADFEEFGNRGSHINLCASAHPTCAPVQHYLCASAHPYNLMSYEESLIRMDPFDIKNLSLPERRRATPSNQKPPRHKAGEKFLKGPIPWKWLTQAAQLPGKAIHVGIVLWFLAGIKLRRTVALSGSILRDFGVDRYAGYRGLKTLEGASLVSVNRHPGRNSLVTILDLEEPVTGDVKGKGGSP